MKNRFVTGCFAIALGGFACGETGAETPLKERIAAIDGDLTVGSTGDGVNALHEYLTQIGYFPNQDLATRFPAWRPIVATAPTDPTVYDENTDLAVRNFQVNMSLPESGIVDAATRSVLKTRLCGYPDGIRTLGGGDKFAYYGSRWPGGSQLKWDIVGTDDVTTAQSVAAAAAAFATWAAQTNLSFTRNLFIPDILITFDTAGHFCASGYAGCEPIPPPAVNLSGSPVTIYLETAVNWSVANPTPTGFTDLQTVLTHEIGHSLGLNHSSFSTQEMFPSTNNSRSLGTEDKAAISSLDDALTNYPGGATDIGVGPDAGALWIIGTSSAFGGNSIWKWVGTNWVNSPGGAVRIAVASDNHPWLVNSSGQIFRRNTTDPTNGNFDLIPGGATDIGAGSEGSIWITGTDPRNGGFGLHKWNGSGWDVDSTGGGAVRIAVDSGGLPWIVNSTGQVLRRTSTDPAQGSWELLPTPSAPATDIGIYTRLTGSGPGGLAWIVAGSTVQIWDEQAACCSNDPAPATRTWVPVFNIVGGSHAAVSVDSNGTPWIVQNNGIISVATR